MSAAGLQSHIWNNNLKSIMLLATYPLIILAMAWVIALFLHYNTDLSNDYVVRHHGQDSAFSQTITKAMAARNQTWDSAQQSATNTIFAYAPLILSGVFVWFIIAWFFHTKMIRSMAHSHPVTRKVEPELYNLTENLCITAGMTMPKLEVVETHARNAFASGIDRKSFTVTVTRGLLQSLSKEEVEAVIAHELTHIQNRDVRLLIITIIFTGMIGFLAQMAWSHFRYASWMGGRSRGNGKGNGLMLWLILIAVLWIGYFATLFTRFAISRKREYMADAGAVQITKNPDAMMRALMRISGSDRIPKMPADVNMMCIENSMPFMGLFSTHPPIEKRITALSETTRSPIPDLPQLRPFYAPRVPRKDAFISPWAGRNNWETRRRFKKRHSGNPWKTHN